MSDWRRLGDEEWRRQLAAAGIAPQLEPSLARYLTLLGRWASAVGLVGRLDADTLVGEHVRESLAGVELLPATGGLLDVGSGNGFPAVPLLLARPGLHGILLEPRERRWAFLRETVRELGLTAEVRRERLEEHEGAGYAAMTVRALAVAEWGARAQELLADGGLVLWWTSGTTAGRAELPGMVPVLHSPLPVPERGVIAVWRRCFT